MKPRLRIGTSGWSYDHWVGPFYPPGLRTSERLAYYARHLDSVEVNSSFYHLPSELALGAWRRAVPDGFCFAVKGSRYITHMKKLKDPESSLSIFLDRIALLESHVGPVLFQLPPHWHFDSDRLERFLAALGNDHRYAFELRDHSWINDRALDLLARHQAAFCIYEFDGFLSPREVTTDFVYLRLHGPDGPYQGDYARQALVSWADACVDWLASGLDVYCYFDNDESGHAVANALTLRGLLDSRT